MGSILGKIAQVGSSFIPGVGPLVSQGIGAAMGAFGGSGQQGQVLQNMTGEYSKDTNQTTSNLQRAIEDPTFAQFRSDLIPLMKQEITKAGQPIYGDAQKAALMNQLNDLAGGAAENLKQGLARSGTLDSGLLSQGLSDIQTNRFGQLSNFFSQLPFMESQERANRMNSLLGMATNWVGAAPVSQFSTGQTTGTESGTNKSSGTTTQQGPSFLKSMASGLGGVIGNTATTPKATTSATNAAGYKLPAGLTLGKNPFAIAGNF